jgi:hypothetical protein
MSPFTKAQHCGWSRNERESRVNPRAKKRRVSNRIEPNLLWSYIAIFLRFREATVSADFDGVFVWVVTKTNRNYVRLPI